MSFLIVIRDVIIVLEFSTQTVLTGVLSDVSEDDSSIDIMPAQILTGQRCLTVLHWVTFAFLMVFFCSRYIGDNLYTMWKRLLLYVRSWQFL